METIYLNARYASQVLETIPVGKWIDKSVGGCGLSHLALTDSTNAIILVPRISLADNKASQVDKYPNLLVVKGGVTADDVREYIKHCKNKKQPFKIVCTYNSFALAKLDSILEETFCNIYVDESQFLIEFATADPLLCIELHNRLRKRVESVSFFSAHPPKREYLPQYIQDMPAIKYVWENQIPATPYIVDTKVPYMIINKIVDEILTKGSYTLNEDITFKKVIIFVNSVSAIQKIAASINKPKKVAYVVGDTVRNDCKLNDYAYRLEDCTKLPTITIGTSSMVSGIDLYDEETFNIVVSSSTKQFTLFDKELDVPQAITRQRLDSNPFNDKFLFLVSATDMEESMSKLEETFNTDLITLHKVVDSLQYLKDGGKEYELAYNQFKGYYYQEEDTFIVNENLLKAKKYVFEQLYKQYTEGYNVISTKKAKKKFIAPLAFKTPTYAEYAVALKYADKTEAFSILKNITNKTWVKILKYGIEENNILVNYTEAKAFYEDRKGVDRILEKTQKKFRVNKFYASAYIKEKLQEIYTKNKLNRKAKATDIYEFFDAKPKSERIAGVKTRGFLIINKIDNEN